MYGGTQMQASLNGMDEYVTDLVALEISDIGNRLQIECIAENNIESFLKGLWS